MALENGRHITLNTPHTKDRTILIVDDNDELRTLMTEYLKMHKYRIVTASDGFEAVEVYSAHGDEIDLILMDVFMPLKNGVEAYKEIRLMNPEIKVIFMSGYDASQLSELEEPRPEYIQKPINPLHLSERIAHYFT